MKRLLTPALLLLYLQFCKMQILQNDDVSGDEYGHPDDMEPLVEFQKSQLELLNTQIRYSNSEETEQLDDDLPVNKFGFPVNQIRVAQLNTDQKNMVLGIRGLGDPNNDKYYFIPVTRTSLETQTLARIHSVTFHYKSSYGKPFYLFEISLYIYHRMDKALCALRFNQPNFDGSRFAWTEDGCQLLVDEASLYENLITRRTTYRVWLLGSIPEIQANPNSFVLNICDTPFCWKDTAYDYFGWGHFFYVYRIKNLQVMEIFT